MEVVTDVRGLLSDESIINDSAPSTFREYNTDQMLQVQSPGGSHKVLITKQGELGHGEYLDPRGNQVIIYDHIRQEVTGSRAIHSGELDSSVEPHRAAFDNAISHYVSEHYLNGTATVYGKKDGRNFVITICISSAKFNPNNFWNGRWRAVWTCKFAPGGAIEINGKLRVNVHYYEDGNVQLTTDTPKTISVNGGNDATSCAEAAAKAIEKCETDYHNKLEHSYNTMGDTTFKALRRVLPITRLKIDWTKIQNYKVGGSISGAAKAAGRGK